jgi:hypothetical protein
MNEIIPNSDKIIQYPDGHIEHEYDVCIEYDDIVTVEHGMITDVSRVPKIITVAERIMG